mmetsp:Transcript_29140/g.83319  ORF Transcript_29140/g.83319 Transcript_29140/m.83319 type:complete len:252 (+) Transcript_29140:655-1410(+)
MFGPHSALMTCMQHFTNPAMPAPPSRCPRFVLEDVQARARRPASLPQILLWAPTSMGSPSAVPVPWHSKQSTSAGPRDASRSAARMHCSCEGPLGAVMLALRPSWLLWLPAASAKTLGESSAMSMRTLEAPSPRPYPSAPTSKVKERPLYESIAPLEALMKLTGLYARLTPAATTAARGSKSRYIKCNFAVCMATNPAEQAVLMVWLDPFKFMRKLQRLDMIASCVPRPAVSCGRSVMFHSVPLVPTKHPM